LDTVLLVIMNLVAHRRKSSSPEHIVKVVCSVSSDNYMYSVRHTT